MSYETHTLTPMYHSHSVCSDCGACSCHTPNLMSMLCSDVYAGSYNTFNHDISDDSKAPVEKAIEILSKDLTEFKSEIRKGLKNSSDFEIRRTAIHWAERQTCAKNMSPRQLQKFIEETENFLRTGTFQTPDADDGITIPISS